MKKTQPHVLKIFCGELYQNNSEDIQLSYYDIGNTKANVELDFNRFINESDCLPANILDLIEIASYVFSADRMSLRGNTDSLYNDGWARTFQFHIPVRDYEFWQNTKLKEALSLALQFMTGDRKYVFNFSKYKKAPDVVGPKQESLFPKDETYLDRIDEPEIMMFSGGLDSLAGAVEFLNRNPKKDLILVSHISQNNIQRTQSQLVNYLKDKYKQNIFHRSLICHYKNMEKGREESQRTRMFLFSAIAFTTCVLYGLNHFTVYENGITSINLPKQTDLINARASRTTHPKTIKLLLEFYKYFKSDIQINTPFSFMTKSEVVEIFKKYNEKNIISSSVSCSSTRDHTSFSHCGGCSQCIDRRFAMFANDLSDFDASYGSEFITDDNNDELRGRLYNTLRFVFETNNKKDFVAKYIDPIIDVVNSNTNGSPDDRLDDLYQLFCRYSDSINIAIKNIRNIHEDIMKRPPDNSLLQMINNRDYMITPFKRKMNEIDIVLKDVFPGMYKNALPKDERDFNNKLQAILKTQGKFEREYPFIRFGITGYIADHSNEYLLIESKYIRGAKIVPSKITGEIASDITMVPSNHGYYCVVYDPERKITDDTAFCTALESKRTNCFIKIYR
jgi:hypothetical protein